MKYAIATALNQSHLGFLPFIPCQISGIRIIIEAGQVLIREMIKGYKMEL